MSVYVNDLGSRYLICHDRRHRILTNWNLQQSAGVGNSSWTIVQRATMAHACVIGVAKHGNVCIISTLEDRSVSGKMLMETMFIPQPDWSNKYPYQPKSVCGREVPEAVPANRQRP
jgi:hypothetical protein